MRPLGPYQRRLLETLADEISPDALLWSEFRLRTTYASLERRGLVEERAPKEYRITEEGLQAVQS